MNWIIFSTGNPVIDTVLSLWIFYLGFILYAGLQPAIKARQWWVVLPAAPVIIPAGVIDVLFNQSVGKLMFLESRYTLTLSQRLDFHWRFGTGWRRRLARNVGFYVNMIFAGHIGEGSA